MTTPPPPAGPAADLDRVELARGYVDAIDTSDGRVTVSGWMLHPDRPCADLRLYLDGALVSEAPIGRRADVAGVFPAVPHAAACGVRVGFPVAALAGRRDAKIDLVGCAAGDPVCRMGAYYRADLASVPAPPPALMHRVAGTSDGAFFKVWGLKCYGDFLEFFDRHGRPGPGDRLLDWGCGCGRLSAHFLAETGGPDVYGCDVDAEAAAYCDAHLRPGRFRAVPLHPPTGYPDGFFTHAIGYSVLTHLTGAVQLEWLAELRRVLAPGGLLVATVHGPSAAEYEFPGRAARLLAGGLFDNDPGNMMDGVVAADYYRGTYQSRAYTEREYGKLFDVLEYKVRGIGNHQDAVVLRRP